LEMFGMFGRFELSWRFVAVACLGKSREKDRQD
jgi:hypothetical protein